MHVSCRLFCFLYAKAKDMLSNFSTWPPIQSIRWHLPCFFKAQNQNSAFVVASPQVPVSGVFLGALELEHVWQVVPNVGKYCVEIPNDEPKLPQGSVLKRSQRIMCLLGFKPDTNRMDALRDQQQLDHRGSSKLWWWFFMNESILIFLCVCC